MLTAVVPRVQFAQRFVRGCRYAADRSREVLVERFKRRIRSKESGNIVTLRRAQSGKRARVEIVLHSPRRARPDNRQSAFDSP